MTFLLEWLVASAMFNNQVGRGINCSAGERFFFHIFLWPQWHAGAPALSLRDQRVPSSEALEASCCATGSALRMSSGGAVGTLGGFVKANGGDV